MINTRLKIATRTINNATWTSDPLDITPYSGVGLQLNTSGAGTGSVKIQRSNDGSHWGDLASATTIAASGTFFIDKNVVYNSLIRVVVTESNSQNMVFDGIVIVKEH